MDIRKQIGEELLLFDGAMGTMLQKYGMKAGQNPEALNLEDPELLSRIHREYVEAGAQFITTNTFGANAYKLQETGYSVTEVITAAVEIAKAATAGTGAQVALDIGPVGKMMKPIGLLDFDQAYDYFREQVTIGAAAGADLILIETMSDLAEMRAAVLAAKENCDLPIFATMTFTEDGNTLTGTEPEIMALSLDALGVDALGVNCSLGPKELIPIIKRILAFTNTPVMVQANAGIPVTEAGVAKYNVVSKDYLEVAKELAGLGVSVIGGCCGTTPEYIRDLQQAKASFAKREINQLKRYVCSAQKKVCLDGQITLIGERINPSGNKALKEQFVAGNPLAAIKVAFEQVQKGADVLDVNTSLPMIDETDYMTKIIDGMSGLVEAPLQFDSTKPEVLEAALRRYSGVAIVNSVNGKESSMAEIYPIVQKYGAFVVALCLDEAGIPDDADGRTKVAQKLIDRAGEYGIGSRKIVGGLPCAHCSCPTEGSHGDVEGIALGQGKHESIDHFGTEQCFLWTSFPSLDQPYLFCDGFDFGTGYGHHQSRGRRNRRHDARLQCSVRARRRCHRLYRLQQQKGCGQIRWSQAGKRGTFLPGNAVGGRRNRDHEGNKRLA